MHSYLQHYINGEWVDSDGGQRHEVINPATEEACTEITLGSQADVDKAVAAAKEAFKTFSQTSVEERVALLERIADEYKKRMPDIAAVMADEMGCPVAIGNAAQAPAGLGHILKAAEVLKDFEFEEQVGAARVVHEPIGVVAMITPWNWPLNQITAKVAPALAAGDTMVLKPSEETPGSAAIFAEIMDAAGVPAGVFNMVQGDGPGVGTMLTKHEDVDMVSFTGSTRAGIMIAKNAADTVKRVHQELGGKTPNIVLEGSDLSEAIPNGLQGVIINSGQSCIAPTRMLVHESQYDEAVQVAKSVMESVPVGDPKEMGQHIGPVVNAKQYEKIQDLIQKGIDEGGKLETGGTGRPDGVNQGFYVKPTVFSNVTNDMTIAREEIFGPVVTLIKYKDDDEAVEIANDTAYGLSACVYGPPEKAKAFTGKLRAGLIGVNNWGPIPDAPFGGYKQSGNGREMGKYGLREFMEVKSIVGEPA
ncbi:aldehyde dehydrogenase family protein [uncultured Parasphingopyxis sp.]|mgnify:CR=1 FL=1|uniref:aldehyde dehydrogenase family protein n=1 Tax=uncultured Parasphingopyxis sp. TaxID=1547918 RepID=UPI00262EB2B1|nr:aldehyde dehydrogenase family protein [uncultured Parasphingopyxis sp.]